MNEKHIETLTAEQQCTNELLDKILAVLRGPEAGTQVLAPASREKPEAPSFTLDCVRQEFLSARERVGKDVAIQTVQQTAGDVKKITEVPENLYGEVIAALQAVDQKEAA